MQKEKMMQIVMAFKAELETYSEQLDLHNKMEDVLRQDMLDCGKLASGEDKTESGERSFVRAAFAMIEGSVFNLKQIALALSKHGKGRFSQAELVMLEEVSYDLDDKGATKSQVKFIPLAKNIKFAFSSAARAFGVAYELKVDDAGWNGFKDALVIRNRITHPKSIDDLKLSEKEVQTVVDAAEWFLRVQRELIQTMMARMEKLKKNLD
jgi:uncharacterized protein YigA (DUF484 family)